MKLTARLLAALALVAASTSIASAQCNGQFAAGSTCGSLAGGVPGAVTAAQLRNLLLGASTWTTDLPMLGNGATLKQGTRSGNTTKYLTTTGTLTAGRCLTLDASGNVIEDIAACAVGGTTQTSTCASPITVATTDAYIYVNASGACTINLPAAAGKIGPVRIIDKNGTAASNNYTIIPNGVELVNGQASLTFATAYGMLQLESVTSGYSATVSGTISCANHALLVGRGSEPPVCLTADTTAGKIFGTTAGGDPAPTSDPLTTTITYTKSSAPSAPSAGQGRIWFDTSQLIPSAKDAGGTLSYMAKSLTCSADQSFTAFSSGGSFTCTANPVRKSTIQINSGGGTVAAGATVYMGPGGTPNAVDTLFVAMMPYAGTLRNMYIHSGGSPGGSETFVYTVMKNGVATGITCTISATASICNDATNTTSVSAADQITVRLVTSGGATARTHSVGIELDAS